MILLKGNLLRPKDKRRLCRLVEYYGKGKTERYEKDEIDPKKTQQGHRCSDADHNPVFHRVFHRNEPEYPEFRFEQYTAAFCAVLHG